MAGGAAQIRMVPVRLRRVVAERAVQRLLVLGGLLIAGWLLGCAAHSAHADELPPPPAASVVAKTPVLGQAVTAVHEREPVRRVVRAVVAKAPRAVTQEPATPPARDVPAVPVAGPLDAASKVAQPAPASHVHPGPRGSRGAPGVLHVSRTRPSIGHVTSHDVRHPAVPAPQQHGDHSAAGGLAIGGLTAGFPNTGSWAPAPPRASVACVVGAIPPAVRTAADEPSFAPD
ncbi:hypothetical protein [Actinomadura bangladeshensis]|uniref:Uncharacterized protein n=1 Tax=Actinomadura bangladeshensis TaxID=453573 RepID=A0A4R4NSI4_9ACTN|nr:hypothetical protein [Actinomadura bangladeshensis]TDC12365.1 hypothetical protein E1284_23885 [Actinomadura bangladeshensis]